MRHGPEVPQNFGFAFTMHLCAWRSGHGSLLFDAACPTVTAGGCNC